VFWRDYGIATGIMEGDAARRRLGLPIQAEADSRTSMAGVPAGCKVFVQSTSFIRKLLARTEFL
jgi:hypothetical protein